MLCGLAPRPFFVMVLIPFHRVITVTFEPGSWRSQALAHLCTNYTLFRSLIQYLFSHITHFFHRIKLLFYAVFSTRLAAVPLAAGGRSPEHRRAAASRRYAGQLPALPIPRHFSGQVIILPGSAAGSVKGGSPSSAARLALDGFCSATTLTFSWPGNMPCRGHSRRRMQTSGRRKAAAEDSARG